MSGAPWLWVLLLAVAARRDLRQLVEWATPGSKPCIDVYKSRLTVYNAGALHKDAIPKLGMGHVTLAGIRHHGLRSFEVWLQSMAPGVATPIHSHPAGCEELNHVLEGQALVRVLDSSGAVRELSVGVNDTMVAPPGTSWQVENVGKVDLRVVVVIGCPQPGITFYPAWNTSAGSTVEAIMPWNKQCPPPLAAAALRQVY